MRPVSENTVLITGSDSAGTDFFPEIIDCRLEPGIPNLYSLKALCEVLGVENDVVNSPTFSIVNEYETNDGNVIYHFDFYRLKHYSEAVDFGLFDYFNSGALCLMEWPENIEELLPDDTVVVTLVVNEDGTRTLTM